MKTERWTSEQYKIQMPIIKKNHMILGDPGEQMFVSHGVSESLYNALKTAGYNDAQIKQDMNKYAEESVPVFLNNAYHIELERIEAGNPPQPEALSFMMIEADIDMQDGLRVPVSFVGNMVDNGDVWFFIAICNSQEEAMEYAKERAISAGIMPEGV